MKHKTVVKWMMSVGIDRNAANLALDSIHRLPECRYDKNIGIALLFASQLVNKSNLIIHATPTGWRCAPMEKDCPHWNADIHEWRDVYDQTDSLIVIVRGRG